MTSNILDYFPGDPRPVQREILLKVQEAWSSTDVIVIEAPTATGKSRIAKTIQRWRKDVDIITPTNVLLEQYVDEFPDDSHIFRAASYPCKSSGKTCGDVIHTKRCKFCPYNEARTQAKESTALMATYHNYMSLWTSEWRRANRKSVAPVLVVDEAHKVIPYLKDLNNAGGWQSELGYPKSARTYRDLKKWVAKFHVEDLNPGHRTQWKGKHTDYQKAKRRYEHLRIIKRDTEAKHPTYIMNRYMKAFRGESRDYLEFTPVSLTHIRNRFWNDTKVRKLILMSATFHSLDLEELGINPARPPKIISCKSPIPAKSRPVLFTPVVDLDFRTMKTEEEASLTTLATHLKDVLLPRHEGQKGLIHITYALARKLKHHPMLQEEKLKDRLLFHDKGEDKKKVYKAFREADPTSGKVLVASGMYEGIDLPENLGRWQVVAKVPWPSKADVAVEWKSRINEKWYVWTCLKDLIQACGRICRTPKDYGVTYILDKSFQKIYNNHQDLFPKWWKESLQVPTMESDNVKK